MTTQGWNFGVSDIANLPTSETDTGKVLAPDGSGGLTWVTASAGVTDHGLLTGLTDDDHTQYLLATGTRTGASSQAQTFTNGIVAPLWKPASDSTSALVMQNAAGTTLFQVDTVNNSFGMNIAPISSATLKVDKSIVGLSLSATGLSINAKREDHSFTIGTRNVVGVDIFPITAAVHFDTKTTTQTGFQITQTVNADTGLTTTVSSLTSVKVNPPITQGAGTKVITASRGFWISNQGNANITTSYGVYLDTQTSSPTSYAIYSNGGQSLLRTGAASTIALVIQAWAAQSANLLEIQDSSANILAKIDANGGLTINEQGVDVDSRIEGNTDANLLFIDAGADRVGIGTNAPASKFHVLDAVANTSSVAQVLTTTTNSTGTAAAGFGGAWVWNLETDTTDDTTAADMSVAWATATHASRKARIDFSPYDTAARLALRLEADGSAPMIGLFGSNAVARQVLAAYTSDGEGSAYTGIDNAQAGTVYAQLADLNTLRVAYETLRASYDDLRTKLQTSTLVA